MYLTVLLVMLILMLMLMMMMMIMMMMMMMMMMMTNDGSERTLSAGFCPSTLAMGNECPLHSQLQQWTSKLWALPTGCPTIEPVNICSLESLGPMGAHPLFIEPCAGVLQLLRRSHSPL